MISRPSVFFSKGACPQQTVIFSLSQFKCSAIHSSDVCHTRADLPLNSSGLFSGRIHLFDRHRQNKHLRLDVCRVSLRYIVLEWLDLLWNRIFCMWKKNIYHFNKHNNSRQRKENLSCSDFFEKLSLIPEEISCTECRLHPSFGQVRLQ